MKKEDTQTCKGSTGCGWSRDGHYECYCYSNEELGFPPDKLTRIREIVLRAMANSNQGEQIIELANILHVIKEE